VPDFIRDFFDRDAGLENGLSKLYLKSTIVTFTFSEFCSVFHPRHHI